MLTRPVLRNRLLDLTLITEPTTPVLTTAEAKAHLEVVHSSDDTLIDSLVAAATRRIETMTRRSLITQTWRVRHLASSLPLPIFRPPVIALTQVSTWYEGTETVEASLSGFYVEPGVRPRVLFTSTGDFTASDIDTVELRYTAGWGATAASVPDDLIAAVRYALATLYDRRDEVGAMANPGVRGISMPGIVEDLVARYILHTV